MQVFAELRDRPANRERTRWGETCTLTRATARHMRCEMAIRGSRNPPLPPIQNVIHPDLLDLVFAEQL